MSVYAPKDDRLHMFCFYHCQYLLEDIGLPVGDADNIKIFLLSTGYPIKDGRRRPNGDVYGTIFQRHTWGFEMISDGSDPDLQFTFSFTNDELNNNCSWRCLEPYKLMGFPRETNEKA